MATHSSVLAWRIPGTGEPDGLPSMGSHRVRHDWSDLAAAAAAAWCHEKKFFFSLRKCAFACWLHHFLTTWPWENHSGFYIYSVQFSHSVVSDSLWPHGLQHTRLSCPSPTSRACSNSCPSCWWCHPTISSSVVPFSPAFNLSQHQGLFQWVSSLHQVAKVSISIKWS